MDHYQLTYFVSIGLIPLILDVLNFYDQKRNTEIFLDFEAYKFLGNFQEKEKMNRPRKVTIFKHLFGPHSLWRYKNFEFLIGSLKFIT